MKTQITFLSIIVFSFLMTFSTLAQDGWKTPKQKVEFKSDDGKEANMEVDQGYMFADLELEGRKFHLFFHRDMQKINKARIIDSKTDLLVARGKGSYFWGNARFEFVDGVIFKVKRKYNPNGYDIIGPYGPLFSVKNHAISTITPLNEKDFIAQAFYVFERIKVTQSNPSDLVIIYNDYHPISSND